jgi:hypothetical protein
MVDGREQLDSLHRAAEAGIPGLIRNLPE